MLEWVPGKPMTRDNLASMKVDSICSQPFPAVFGFKPSAMDVVVPEYLAPATARARYQQFRNGAGR
jgi:NADH dehydrogenase